MKVENIKTIVEISQGVATTLGIFIAGVWSLWLFRFSRSFAGRLVIDLFLEKTAKINDLPTGIVRVTIRNVGRTRVRKGYCILAINEVEDPFPSRYLHVFATDGLRYHRARKIFDGLIEIEPGEEYQSEYGIVFGKAYFIKVGVKFRRADSSEIWESSKIFFYKEN